MGAGGQPVVGDGGRQGLQPDLPGCKAWPAGRHGQRLVAGEEAPAARPGHAPRQGSRRRDHREGERVMDYLLYTLVGAAEFASVYFTMNWLLGRWAARREVRQAIEALV